MARPPTDLEREKTPRQPTDLEREKTPSWKALRTKPPRGGTLSPDAWRILDSVSRRTGHNLEVQQGGHNASGDPTSKGTHDGGGAVDLFVKGLPKQKRLDVVAELRNQGAAAWLRTPEYGWNVPNDDHIHAIFIDDPELSPVAAEQVRQYNKGLNGLANHAPDPFKNLKVTSTPTATPIQRTALSSIIERPRRRRRTSDLEREKTPPRPLKPIITDLEWEKTPGGRSKIQFDDQKVDTSDVKVLGQNGNFSKRPEQLKSESLRRELEAEDATRSPWEKFVHFFVGGRLPPARFNEKQEPPKPLTFDFEGIIRSSAEKNKEILEALRARHEARNKAREKMWDDYQKSQSRPEKQPRPRVPDLLRLPTTRRRSS